MENSSQNLCGNKFENRKTSTSQIFLVFSDSQGLDEKKNKNWWTSVGYKTKNLLTKILIEEIQLVVLENFEVESRDVFE